MARHKVRIPIAVCDAKETDVICDINIEVKVAGVDLKSLSSAGKVFRAYGREHPMSRFGSWVFQGSSASDQARQIGIDGGIVASLTWGLLQICPQVELWVNNIAGCCFTMQLDEGLKVSMLERIAKGVLAKDLQHTLSKRIPRIYKDIRIRQIKILDGPGSTGTGKRAHGKKFLSKSSVAREFERISRLIQIPKYELAYDGLKRMIDNKMGDSERVHVLIRLGICCLHLKKDSEIEDIVKRLLRLTENMEDCSPPLDTFIADITTFADRLMEAAEMSTYSINIYLACNKIIRKIEDSNDRLENLNQSVRICVRAMMKSLLIKPMIKLKVEFQQYLRKLEEEVQYTKMMEGCDELRQWRAVYYSLHALNNLKARMGEPVSNISDGHSVLRFACAESSWADFTRVMCLGDEYEEVALMFSDLSFVKLANQISENPALLEKRYADPRIRKINTLLNQPFYKPTPMSGFTRLGLESVESLKERKKMAKKEKKKGDAAFKKMEYEKALRHYDKAIEIDPSEALHHSDKAEVLIRQNHLDKAEQSCLTAMDIAQSNRSAGQKDFAKIFAIHAHVELLNRRYDAALELYHKSLALHDDMNVREQIFVATCMKMLPWLTSFSFHDFSRLFTTLFTD